MEVTIPVAARTIKAGTMGIHLGPRKILVKSCPMAMIPTAAGMSRAAENPAICLYASRTRVGRALQLRVGREGHVAEGVPEPFDDYGRDSLSHLKEPQGRGSEDLSDHHAGAVATYEQGNADKEHPHSVIEKFSGLAPVKAQLRPERVDQVRDHQTSEVRGNVSEDERPGVAQYQSGDDCHEQVREGPTESEGKLLVKLEVLLEAHNPYVGETPEEEGESEAAYQRHYIRLSEEGGRPRSHGKQKHREQQATEEEHGPGNLEVGPDLFLLVDQGLFEAGLRKGVQGHHADQGHAEETEIPRREQHGDHEQSAENDELFRQVQRKGPEPGVRNALRP